MGTAIPRTSIARYSVRMLRIRRIEEAIESRYHEDEMKTPIHLVIGQEATSVGCCAALTASDLLYSSHRTHGNYLAKGGDLRAMLCEMYCRINGCVGLPRRFDAPHRQERRHGGYIGDRRRSHADRHRSGARRADCKGEDRVVVVFLGDAATEEGAASESLNFAVLKQLPIVFFCENNFYSGAVAALDAPAGARDLELGAGLRHAVRAGRRHERARRVSNRRRDAVARARSGGGPDVHRGAVLPLSRARRLG